MIKAKSILIGLGWLATNLSAVGLGFYVAEYNRKSEVQLFQSNIEVQQIPDPVWELSIKLIETCPSEGKEYSSKGTNLSTIKGCTFLKPKALEVAEELLLPYGIDLDFTTVVSEVPFDFAANAAGYVTEEELDYLEYHAVAEHRDSDIHLYLLNTRITGATDILGMYLPGGDYIISNYLVGNEETTGFVIAHEVAHALGLEHVEAVDNLMYAYDIEGSPFLLEEWQINLMKANMNYKWGIRPEKYDG